MNADVAQIGIGRGTNPDDLPQVSVITIFLNAEQFIREAIESVLHQDDDRWELLLVDDGSSDASREITKQYAEQHPARIRYLEHDGHANRGMSASRNLGIRHARGRYIAFLDSDDLWFPFKLQRQVAILEQYPEAAMVYGATEYWHSWTGNPADVDRDHTPDLGVQLNALYQPPTLSTLLYPLGHATAPSLSGLMLRRDIVERVGGFEESFKGMYEDQAFLAKVYLRGAVFVSSECWDRYRIHPGSCMALMAQSDQYDAVRLFFLNWLGVYLYSNQIEDAGMWSALRSALQTASGGGVHGGPQWSLRFAGGSFARLVTPPGDPGTLHVDIQNAETRVGFDIQLNLPHHRLEGGHRYSVHFRARAASPRSIAAGIAEAHEPWAGLGWYQRFDLTTGWQVFEAEFVAQKGEVNTRIHFDLGEDSSSVELSGIALRHLPDGQMVEATPAAKGAALFGGLRHLSPISRNWGFDRGQPIDRYYIERFLTRHTPDVRGRVLEIEDNVYTRRFGADRVTISDILHVAPGNPRATVIGDLTRAEHIPSDLFDCVILTQTLHLIYDTRAALGTLYRILKPGGVLLATFPGLSRTSHDEWAGSWFWGFTAASARRLFQESFSPEGTEVEQCGNVLSAIAFLHGLAAEELRQEELDYVDPDYELLIAVRAVKAELQE